MPFPVLKNEVAEEVVFQVFALPKGRVPSFPKLKKVLGAMA